MRAKLHELRLRIAKSDSQEEDDEIGEQISHYKSKALSLQENLAKLKQPKQAPVKLVSRDITNAVKAELNKGETQAAHDIFGQLLGVSRAEQLLHLYRETYDHRTEYDRLMGKGISKTEKFRKRARRDGYSDDEIEAFLLLQ